MDGRVLYKVRSKYTGESWKRTARLKKEVLKDVKRGRGHSRERGLNKKDRKKYQKTSHRMAGCVQSLAELGGEMRERAWTKRGIGIESLLGLGMGQNRKSERIFELGKGFRVS